MCSNKIWFNILNKFGKYAHGKLIPEWVQNAPKHLIQEFINGYMKADGCINKDGSHQITTVSFNLALGTQRLYLKLGHIFSVIKQKRPPTCVIEGRTLNQRNTYKIVGWLNKKKKQKSFIDKENNYAWYAPFKLIKKDTEEVKVYNFEVEEDHTYTVENIIVLNCQPFSIAGKQKGFEDKRSNVFHKIVKILEHHKPRFVILENVKNLKGHDKGNTFKVICEKLTNCGYKIKHQILNTCKVTNIPQNRERIYIVCFKNQEDFDKFDFNFPEVEVQNIQSCLETTIPEKYYYTDRFKVYDTIKKDVVKHVNTNTVYQYRRHYTRENKSSVSPTLTANMGGGGHNVPLILDDKGIRKLTPRECFNLQGFPSDFVLPNLCDSKLYKLAGNAVSVPVIELLSKKIFTLID